MRLLSLVLCLATLGCSHLTQWGVRAPKKDEPFFRVRWSKNFDVHNPGNLGLTYGGVASADDVLYVGTLGGVFQAIDTETGRVLWSQQEAKSIAAPGTVFGEYVYYGTQAGRLIVRQRLSGALKYAIDLGSPIESAPVIANGRMLIYLRGHQIACLDAETGKIIWNYRRAVPVTVTLQRTTKPLVVGERVIVGFADGFAGALSLQEGTLLWEQKMVETQKFVDVDLNPVFTNGIVITGSPSGELKGLDPRDGSVRRQYPVQALSQPLLRGEAIIVGDMDGAVSFLDLQGKVLKKAQVSAWPINQLVWWKDHIVTVNLKGEVQALDPLSLTKVDEFLLGHDQSAVFGDLTSDDSGLGMLTSRNRLFYFQ